MSKHKTIRKEKSGESKPLEMPKYVEHPGGESVTERTTLTYGTLGCLAKDNTDPDKIVLLSNYHVLHSIDEDNVFHPRYKSSKTNKIAERLRKADPGTLGNPSTVDAAIAKLDDDIKADPKIVDIGWVEGTHEVTLEDICLAKGLDLADPCNKINKEKCSDIGQIKGYRVRKRGITTLLTEGTVIGVCGDFKEETPPEIYLKNQLVIMPLAGGGHGAFSARGDSGSAVVNDKNQVVGLLMGADANGWGFASPIKEVEKKLNITIWSRGELNGTAGDEAKSNLAGESEDLQITVPIPELLTQVKNELRQSEAGMEYISLIERHYNEVEQLIHNHKRVMVIWRRNHGPAIIRELLRLVEERNVVLPSSINGLPMIECFKNILGALKKFGSESLESDIWHWTPSLLQLGSITYSDFLDNLSANYVAH